jgi:hypothetical protein
MKRYFPELTKEFDKMMDVYADPSTIFKKVTGIGSSGPRTTAPINTNAPIKISKEALEKFNQKLPVVLPESFKSEYGLSDVSYVNASELPERPANMQKTMYDSIAEDGVLLPILIDKDWAGSPGVMDGVHRVAIAKDILERTGKDIKVPVIYGSIHKLSWDDIPKIQEFLLELWYNNKELPNKETNEV